MIDRHSPAGELLSSLGAVVSWSVKATLWLMAIATVVFITILSAAYNIKAGRDC